MSIVKLFKGNSLLKIEKEILKYSKENYADPIQATVCTEAFAGQCIVSVVFSQHFATVNEGPPRNKPPKIQNRTGKH